MKLQRLTVLTVAGLTALTMTACGSGSSSSSDVTRPSAPMSQQEGAERQPSADATTEGDGTPNDAATADMQEAPIGEVISAYGARYDAFINTAISSDRAFLTSSVMTENGQSITLRMTLNPDGSSTSESTSGSTAGEFFIDCPQADACYISTDGGDTWTFDASQSELSARALDPYDSALMEEAMSAPDAVAYTNGDNTFELNGEIEGQPVRFTMEFIGEDRFYSTVSADDGSMMTIDMAYADPVPVADHS